MKMLYGLENRHRRPAREKQNMGSDFGFVGALIGLAAAFFFGAMPF